MKLTTREITIFKVLGIILAVALIIVSMFYPEYVRNPYSIKDIGNKQEEISNLNNTVASNESTISSDSRMLEQLRRETLDLETEYNRLDAGLVNTEFELHIPSILITLEQEAKNNELEMKIDYENITTHTVSNEPSGPDAFPEDHDLGEEHYEEFNDDFEEEHPEEIEDLEEELGQGGDELSEEELEMIDDADEAPEETEEEAADTNLDLDMDSSGTSLSEEHGDITSDVIQVNIPMIEGVQTTTIKINLNGTYENMRNFILAIDEIDFIEHNVIDLLSYGDSLSGVIVLNIFHTENGGGVNE